jgi:predicted transcriptional regulator
LLTSDIIDIIIYMNQAIQFPAYTKTQQIARALSNQLRCEILNLLVNEDMNISQISTALKIPQSTCTSNIKILEAADLIESHQKPGTSHGTQKICSLKYTKTLLPIVSTATKKTKENLFVTAMPIGLFTDFSIQPPCGMCGKDKMIGIFDNVSTFLSPDRARAELLWFTWGFIKYRFPKDFPADVAVKSVSFSAEICSEYPGYNNDWPSDISLGINGIDVGTWTSPGDMGGDHGSLTPEWWGNENTQYGFLTKWKINTHGTWIADKMISTVSVKDLQINKYTSISVQIGVKENAKYRGGINIFGSKFGNFSQNLVLEIETA